MLHAVPTDSSLKMQPYVHASTGVPAAIKGAHAVRNGCEETFNACECMRCLQTQERLLMRTLISHPSLSRLHPYPFACISAAAATRAAMKVPNFLIRAVM